MNQELSRKAILEAGVFTFRLGSHAIGVVGSRRVLLQLPRWQHRMTSLPRHDKLGVFFAIGRRNRQATSGLERV